MFIINYNKIKKENYNKNNYYLKKLNIIKIFNNITAI